LNPSCSQARFQYACLLEEEGHPDEALHQMRMARETDPQSRVIVHWFVRLLFRLRRLDEMKTELEGFKSLDSSGSAYHQFLAMYHAGREDFEAAIQEALRGEELSGEEEQLRALVTRASIYAMAGDKARAKALLEELRRQPETWDSLTFEAMVSALLGDLDECFRLLTKAWNEYHGLALQFFRTDPSYEAVRRDSRFADLLKTYGLKV